MNPAPAPLGKPVAWRWGITGLLLLATTVNYMDRVALANAAVRVSNDLQLSNLQYGHLELAFGWAFAAGSIVFGFLADRWGVYLLYPGIIALWSLMGAASGLSHGFDSLLICRTFLGFFEAGHWPCAVKTTFMVLNDKERTMGNSLLQSGASIGAIITPQLMRLLMGPEVGAWRQAFIIVGAAGFVWVLLWFVSLRPADLEDRRQTLVLEDSPKLFDLMRGPKFWALALLIAGAQTVWHVPRVWLSKFLQTGRGLDEASTLNFSSLYYLATDVGCILAGIFSLWLVRQGGCTPHQARRTVYAGATLLTSLSLCIPFLQKGVPLLGVLLLIGAGALALFPCYYSFVQELSPHHVGRMTGLLSMWVWAVTSPMHSAFGWLADRTHSFDAGLAAAGLAPWLGILSMKFLWRDNSDAARR